MSKYIIGAGAIVTTIGLAPIVLGFGSTGIIAGSVAAGIQSAIGNVAAGSIFASLTSMGMTGTFTGITAGGLGTIGAGVTMNLFNKNQQTEGNQRDISS